MTRIEPTIAHNWRPRFLTTNRLVQPGAGVASLISAPRCIYATLFTSVVWSEFCVTLGRSLCSDLTISSNVLVPLLEPGTLYGDRINQLDIRVSRMLRVGRTRTTVGVDLYNATNSSAIQTYNETFGANWLTPTLVLPARFAKVSAQIEF